ncbi:hypothetical protein N431DRAFT_429026 [Stipitochalara longipes BDJ]|nr:hypothetical protein N431DRAFT_429026 [Stipitochalara longipes BDJ]
MVVPLPYTLHTRYASIAIAWTVILIPPIFINLGLFYGLWYGTHLDRILVLTLPTAILGIFTIIGIAERIYKLTHKSPQYRPLSAGRLGLDIFQWGYFLALLLISALISSTLARGDTDNDGHQYQIRLLSLPTAVLMYMLSTLTLLSLIGNALKIKLPFRFGSSEPGTVIRPAIFYIVEDVVAVDGNGGIEYREAFNARYESSEIFQNMIWNLSVCWMLAFYVMGAVITVLVLVLPVASVYAVGWAGPFPVAGLMVVVTIFYVKSVLRLEGKEEHGDERVGDDERAPLLSGGS